MATQISLNDGAIASAGALAIQTNGTTQAVSISTGQVATLAQNPILTSGTANGVAYLNGSKALTTGSALVFDGTNLGVGVTPSATASGVKSFEMQGVGSGLVSFGSADTVVTAGAFYSSTGWKYAVSSSAVAYYYQTAGVHQWFTAASGTAGNALTATQAMTLDTSGNLLVGTTSTFSADFRMSILVASGTGGIMTKAQSAVGSTPMGFLNSSAVVVGSIATNATTTSYVTSSDYRLKNTITPMTGALSKVALLKPCTYKWNSDGSDGEGFIAHELAEVLPQAVTGEKDAVGIQQYEISPAVPATFDEDGNVLTSAIDAVMGEREEPKYQGVDTSFLVATLTAAIQEQQALITQLQADVAALKGA